MTTKEKIRAIAACKGIRPVAQLTAYDYPTTRLLDETGAVDMLLVGDSLGMMVLGYPDTTSVTMQHMLHHTEAVARAHPQALLVADMPVHTYDTPQLAVQSAKALIAAGAEAVKLEGGAAVQEQIRAIISTGIPVQGHIGLLPQHIKEDGGYRMRGKTDEEVETLLRDLRAVEAAGVFSAVIECTRAEAAAQLTASSSVITIGIGSGHGTCDGEVQVFHDLVGGFPWFVPRFAAQHAHISQDIKAAAQTWAKGLILPPPPSNNDLH